LVSNQAAMAYETFVSPGPPASIIILHNAKIVGIVHLLQS